MKTESSKRTSELKREVRNLKARLRRANGYGGFTKPLDIRSALEGWIKATEAHLENSESNDRKFPEFTK